MSNQKIIDADFGSINTVLRSEGMKAVDNLIDGDGAQEFLLAMSNMVESCEDDPENFDTILGDETFGTNDPETGTKLLKAVSLFTLETIDNIGEQQNDDVEDGPDTED